MAERKVSVVIPCYNSQNTISKVIVGLLSQTVKPLEIILVNDASTDETVKVVEKYDIKIINNPVNIGPAASRNRGFLECQGDIILFIDSDAVPSPNLIEVLICKYYECIPHDRHLGGMGGRGIEMILETTADKWRSIHGKQDWGKKPRNNVLYLFGLCSSYTRKALEAVNGFDDFYRLPAGEDLDLGLRLKKMGFNLYYSPEAIVFHYHRDNIASLLRNQKNWTKWNLIAHKRNGKLGPRQIIGSLTKPILFTTDDLLRYHDPQIAKISLKVLQSRISAVREYFSSIE